MTDYFGQGYPLYAETQGRMAGGPPARRYLVIGWETGNLGHAVPLLVPADAPGGRPEAQSQALVEGASYVFAAPTPVRELVAELSDALDTFERDSYLIEPYDRPIRLVGDLRRLLERWSS